MLRVASKLLKSAPWLNERLSTLLRDVLDDVFESRDTLRVLEQMPLGGTHARVAELLLANSERDMQGTLTVPQAQAEALALLLNVVQKWSRQAADGAAMCIMDAAALPPAAPGDAALDAGCVVTLLPGGDSRSALVSVRVGGRGGPTVNLPRAALEAAAKDDYEGRLNVEHALQLMGVLAETVLQGSSAAAAARGAVGTASLLARWGDEDGAEEGGAAELAFEDLLGDLVLQLAAQTSKLTEEQRAAPFCARLMGVMTRAQAVAQRTEKAIREQTIDMGTLRTLCSAARRARTKTVLSTLCGMEEGVLLACEAEAENVSQLNSLCGSLFSFFSNQRVREAMHDSARDVVVAYEELQRQWDTRRLCDLVRPTPRPHATRRAPRAARRMPRATCTTRPAPCALRPARCALRCKPRPGLRRAASRASRRCGSTPARCGASCRWSTPRSCSPSSSGTCSPR